MTIATARRFVGLSTGNYRNQSISRLRTGRSAWVNERNRDFATVEPKGQNVGTDEQIAQGLINAELARLQKLSMQISLL